MSKAKKTASASKRDKTATAAAKAKKPSSRSAATPKAPPAKKSGAALSSKKKPTPPTAAKKSAAPRRKTPAAPPGPGATTITARVDVGFGNALFIRGEGPGMSWDRGIRMECIEADVWQWTSIAAIRPFPCKVLINDEIWAQGDDIQVQPGGKIVFQPTF